jgi:hypothetical protein
MMLYRTITKEHAGVYWKPVLPDGPLRVGRPLRGVCTVLGKMIGASPHVGRHEDRSQASRGPCGSYLPRQGTPATKWPLSAQEARPAGHIF